MASRHSRASSPGVPRDSVAHLPFPSHSPVILVTDGLSGIKHKRIVPLEWTDHLTGKVHPRRCGRLCGISDRKLKNL